MTCRTLLILIIIQLYTDQPIQHNFSTVCQFCCGWRSKDKKIISIGDTIGIIVAQYIGEPRTQLTIRTFHTGGIFSSKIRNIFCKSIEGKFFYLDLKNLNIQRFRIRKFRIINDDDGTHRTQHRYFQKFRIFHAYRNSKSFIWNRNAI